MKAIAKNIGKLNQLVGEKLHSAHKHDLSDEFKQLEQQLEVRKEGTESILQACTAYVNTLEKRKDGADKQKRLIISNLGLAMVQYGSEMNEDSSYGQALLKMGAAQQNIGDIQSDFAMKLTDTFIASLEMYAAEMKTYKHLRAKLENRRLDYDAKMNKISKVKKENPALDEEMRSAQTKYEETLAEIEEKMIQLNQTEEPQLIGLLKFADAQAEYHHAAWEQAEELKKIISDASIRAARVQPAPLVKTPTAASSTQVSPNSITVTPQRSMHQQDFFEAVSSSSVKGTSSYLTMPTTATRQTSDITYSSSLLGPSSSTQQSPTHSSTNLSVDRRLVRANYSFVAENPEELSLVKGDIISVIAEIDQGWWIGESNGGRGIFPSNYCEPVVDSPETPISPTVTSLRTSLPHARSLPRFLASSENIPPKFPSTFDDNDNDDAEDPFKSPPNATVQTGDAKYDEKLTQSAAALFGVKLKSASKANLLDDQDDAQ